MRRAPSASRLDRSSAANRSRISSASSGSSQKSLAPARSAFRRSSLEPGSGWVTKMGVLGVIRGSSRSVRQTARPSGSARSVPTTRASGGAPRAWSSVLWRVYARRTTYPAPANTLSNERTNTSSPPATRTTPAAGGATSLGVSKGTLVPGVARESGNQGIGGPAPQFERQRHSGPAQVQLPRVNGRGVWQSRRARRGRAAGEPSPYIPVIRQLIDIQPPLERAFLVGAPRKGSDEIAQVDEHLDELSRLADTAGAQVVGRTYQRVESPSPNFYLGQGKVEELKDVLAGAGATLVMFDEGLSPVQGVNLEKHLGLRVMDRTEVILDIFATRARSHEARLQVELAQLEYLLPRLTRMWTHLSRIRGGIGLRGPGETQLETDRRAIRRKIGILKKRLDDVADHRANQRQGRGHRPSAALVGYTNAGKSSLLKALSGDDVFVEDRLFATLDTLTREVDVGEGYRFRVTDTVGFIRKLPHLLVASFRATLEEAKEADLLLHVIETTRR